MYSSVVISKSDLARIKNTIIPIENEADLRHSVDMNLKSICSSKIKEWPDSVEMANQNKMNERKKEFLAAEEMKRKIDAEEKKYMDIQKKSLTNKAQETLFYAQDPVKSFVAKMLHCDVLSERKIQQQLKENKNERAKRYDDYWYLIEQQKMVDYDRKEQEKREIERLKKQAEMHIINQQFKESQIRRIQDRQEQYIEGQVIKQNALKAIEEQHHKEDLMRLQAQRLNDEFVQANTEIERLKELKRLDNEKEESLINEYAKKKQQLIDLRERKEGERTKEKHDRRQRLIDAQVENLKKIKSKEDEIITKHIEQTEKKKANDEAEKKAKFDKLQQSIFEDRELYLKRLRDTKEKDLTDGKERAEKWRQEVKEMEAEDRRKYFERRQKQKDLKDYQLKQANDKRNQAFEDFRTVQESAYYTKKMLATEQDNFILFAEEKIKEYVKQGKEILPLLLELKNYKQNNQFA